MKEVTVETAKTGDRVWSVLNGWGTIIQINRSDDYPIDVQFDKSGTIYDYLENGKQFADNIKSDLYWDEIKFEAPEKPKRKVKKEVNVWLHRDRKGEVYNPILTMGDCHIGIAECQDRTYTVPAKLTFEIEE